MFAFFPKFDLITWVFHWQENLGKHQLISLECANQVANVVLCFCVSISLFLFSEYLFGIMLLHSCRKGWHYLWWWQVYKNPNLYLGFWIMIIISWCYPTNQNFYPLGGLILMNLAFSISQSFGLLLS